MAKGTSQTEVTVNAAEIIRIINDPPKLEIGDNDLENAFWMMHPRYKFFKSLPMNAKLLDVGANQGGLSWWLDWGKPVRLDLTLYGIDLQRGEWSDRYAGWDVVDLDERAPEFPGIAFDSYLATHLIEHLNNPDDLFDYMSRAAAPNASVYLEWPSPKTMYFPPASSLREQGFDIQTFNFFDDSTHIRTYSHQDISQRLAQRGFSTLESGEITIGQVARDFLAQGRVRNDLTWRQIGLWCAVGWCDYVIARKY